MMVKELSVVLGARFPGLTTWFDLRHHPWRFAASVAVVVGLGLAGGHAVSEGVSLHHLAGGLLAAALIAAIEALAVLLGFAVLGRFLAIRPPRTEA
jgi:hypothetical protein